MTSVIVAGARTPMGRYQGALSGLTAVQLGGHAIAAALARAGVAADEVDHVVMGNVVQAGNGQAPARQAAALGGLGPSVPATTINTVCLSGIDAVMAADRLIRLDEADIVVAGGMESMSRAPHLLAGSRGGMPFGPVTMMDALEYDGLWDIRTGQSMGSLTDHANDEGERISREEQDAFSARSHRLAAAARDAGVFADEIAPIDVSSRRQSVTVSADEGIRDDTSTETLAKLRSAFFPGGTITAGSSSPLSDGGAALVIVRRELAEERGLPWIAEIGASGQVAGPDSTLQHQPANAIRRALGRDGTELDEVDLIEINEAFAVVGLSSVAKLGVDPDRVNVHGGAIALGHPLGMSGARLVLTLALSLERDGLATGVAALCGGSGQGSALVLHGRSRS
ncbi:MAG TPA: acetyl-CoA C-acyltransferase [Gryllotalpicola sp.]